MKNTTHITRALIIIVIASLSACTKDEGPVIIEEVKTVSYSTDIQPIFTNKCVTCHDQNHSTGLNLKQDISYNLLVNIASTGYSPTSRIKPFSKENSVLWHKVNNTGVYGGKMPQIGDALTSLEIQKIEKWITSGALNN